MRQQGIGRKQDPRHGIFLIRIELYLLRHSGKLQKAPVKMSLTDITVFFEIDRAKIFRTFRILPYPFLKIFNHLFLLFHSIYSGFFIDHLLNAGFCMFAFHRVIYSHGALVQCTQQYIQSIPLLAPMPPGASVSGRKTRAVKTHTVHIRDLPAAGHLVMPYLRPPQTIPVYIVIPGILRTLYDKFFDHIARDPWRSERNIDFIRRQRRAQKLFQRFHIRLKIPMIVIVFCSGSFQFFENVSREIFVCHLPSLKEAFAPRIGVLIDRSL